MTDHFALLKSQLPTFDAVASTNGANSFFGQEVLRFHSMAGTLLENFSLDESNVDERYITHVITRSLLENFFWLIYIYDDPTNIDSRYNELINSFKKNYVKLLNVPLFPKKDQMEPADQSWKDIPRGLDVSSMLDQVKNEHGDSLKYLYFLYRVTSFDTHGQNLNAIFQTVFGKTCNFPILDLRYGFDLIANQYLVILQDLQSRSEI